MKPEVHNQEPNRDETNLILTNLVRLHTYEILQKQNPEIIDSFPEIFTEWISSISHDQNPQKREHPVYRLSDMILKYFSASEHFVPHRSSTIKDITDRMWDKDEALWSRDMMLGERLQMDLYDLWGTESSDDINLDDIISCELVGTNHYWLNAVRLAIQAARCDFPVLITGESGVGKDLIANAIHANSQRSTQKLVTINCAALPEGLVESELFGYSEGAFTGARRNGKIGRIESAAGGTLVLDEISELSIRSQAALLRTLQNGELQKIGGDIIHADFRLISISNRPLEPEVDSGRFRRDLYYRIAVIPIVVPPLRERPDDIEPLVVHFLAKFHRANPHLTAQQFHPDAIAALKVHQWQGNVREVENVVARAMVLCRGETIMPHHLVFNTDITLNHQSDTKELTARISSIKDPIISRIDLNKLADFLRSNSDHITSGDYAHRFGCSSSTAQRHLDILRRSGLLEHAGDKRGSRYYLIE